MLNKIWGLATLIILDGVRRHALIGLILMALLLEAGGLIYIDFIPRDIGRASADFILSIGWVTGFLFLLFHAVQVMAWDEERRTIHTILSRPISRTQYVLGVFLGLATLLLILNIILSSLGFCVLILIKNSVMAYYFNQLSVVYYCISWVGLYCIELIILSVILLFSGLVRGGFQVLILSVSYYLICIGLPVVREGVELKTEANAGVLDNILQGLTLLFPDLNRFDFKSLITNETVLKYSSFITTDILLVVFFLGVVLRAATLIYKRRDLQ